MAIRPNPSLPNRHTGYLACSGFGKSQALKQNPDIPKRGVRVLLWDPDEDHRATRYEKRNDMIKAVLLAMKSGRGFRIAWNGAVDPETFEWFCTLVWHCLDGDRALYIIIEELSDVQPSAGKASPMFGQLFRRARKYHGILHWTSQRSEEVSKTAYSQTHNYYIGYPNDTCTDVQARKLARIAGRKGRESDLYDLVELQFYKKIDGNSELVTLKYKNL